MNDKFIGYTVGNKENYDKWLDDCERRRISLMKMGCRDGCDGGTVWKSLGAVRQYLSDNLSKFEYTPEVYGVSLILGWNKDVSSKPNEDGFHYLLVDRPIFKLPGN